jgi:hypothetical protein
MYNTAYQRLELINIFNRITSSKSFYENRLIEALHLIEGVSNFTVSLDYKRPEKSYYKYKKNGRNISNIISYDSNSLLFQFDNGFYHDEIMMNMIQRIVRAQNEGDFLFKYTLPVMGEISMRAVCLGNFPTSKDEIQKNSDTNVLTIIFTLLDKKSSDRQVIECLKVILALTTPYDYNTESFNIVNHHFNYVAGYNIDRQSKSFENYLSVLQMMDI